MAQPGMLLPKRFGIPLAVAILVYGILTRNVVAILLVLGSFLLYIPVPLLHRALYSAIYFWLATAGVLVYAASQDALSGRVYLVASCLGLFAIGGSVADLYGRKDPEKNPDLDT